MNYCPGRELGETGRLGKPGYTLGHLIKTEHEVMIAGALSGGDMQAFRIGHMGPQATGENVVGVLIALEGYLRQAGQAVKSGQCLAGVDPEILR